MKYYEMMQKSLEELMEPVLDAMPIEQRLRGLAPEQRLQGLTPEQVDAAIDALPAEVREQLKQRLH